MQLHVATLEDVRSKRVTDVYFRRAVEVLRAKGVDPVVTAEFHCGSLPGGAEFGVFCGLEEIMLVLQGLPVDVEGLAEGGVFCCGEPVLTITGNYTVFGELETAVLGLMCQSSGIATKAARCKLAAGERSVISFGARRMHPALAPMIERAAYIGGCDGFAVVKSADLIGIPPTGTMPHALILIAGDLPTALRWFDEVIDEGVPRIALIDTFTDEKLGALEAAETLGQRLDAVRLDTPGSRRGNMLELLREVRWELDLRGHRDVRLLVSGGLDEYDILELNAVADGYGVGTAISSAPVVNFAMDIVEIEGRPIAKRGKRSGRKQLVVCPSCRARTVVPYARAAEHAGCRCGAETLLMVLPLLRQGEPAVPAPSIEQIRDRRAQQVATLTSGRIEPR
ncbi:MAG: nicotinate phosphoribosyltransferase [Armatimonadetes bacterium]|nr:nicotinate phosphoribosyltransferase [Armatimonadota bacterium]